MKKLFFFSILFSVLNFSQQIDNPEWKNYLNSEVINCIAEDGDYLWVGSQAGLTKLNKGTHDKEFFNKGNSLLPANTIFDIKIDPAGYKWIATLRDW